MNEKKCMALEIIGELDPELLKEAEKNMENLKKQKREKVRFWRNATTAAACMALAFIGVCAGNTKVRATVMESVGKLGDFLGLGEKILPYTDIICQEQTNSGITLTLEEVIQTDTQILMAYSWKLEEGTVLAKDMIGLGVYSGILEINGEEILSMGSRILSDIKEKDLENKKTEGSFVIRETFGAGKLPKHIKTMNTKLDIYTTMEEDEPPVSFEFKFKVSKEELRENILTYEIDETLQDDQGLELVLSEIEMTPVNSRIYVKGNEVYERICNSAPEIYYLKGVDSFGNSLKFERYGIDGEMIYFDSDCEDSYVAPDTDSEWIELQLYKMEPVEVEWDKEKLQTAEQRTEEVMEAEYEEFTETDDVVSYIPDEAVPVGNIVRIPLDKSKKLLSETEIIGGADEPTYIYLK